MDETTKAEFNKADKYSMELANDMREFLLMQLIRGQSSGLPTPLSSAVLIAYLRFYATSFENLVRKDLDSESFNKLMDTLNLDVLMTANQFSSDFLKKKGMPL